MKTSEIIHFDTLYEEFGKTYLVPERPINAPMLPPISESHKIKGVGNVFAVRVKQDVAKHVAKVVFLPIFTGSNPRLGKVLTVEMHHVLDLNLWERSAAVNVVAEASGRRRRLRNLLSSSSTLTARLSCPVAKMTLVGHGVA